MKQRILNFLFKYVAFVTVPDDVITDRKGVLYLGDKPLDEIELRNLEAEVKAFESMRLWSILNETIKQKAYERGWKRSTTMEELNIAKAEFAVLETQASIIKVIKERTHRM